MDRLCQVKEADKVEYEVLLLQFACVVIVALEEAQDGHITQGVGRGVEMVHNRKVLSFVANRVQAFQKATSWSHQCRGGHIGSSDAIDHIDGCAGEPLSDVRGLFGALDGGEGGGVGA
eukprot:g37584.t1